MLKYNLYSLLKEELKNGSNDLVTRPSGQVMRERIERDIKKENIKGEENICPQKASLHWQKKKILP